MSAATFWEIVKWTREPFCVFVRTCTNVQYNCFTWQRWCIWPVQHLRHSKGSESLNLIKQRSAQRETKCRLCLKVWIWRCGFRDKRQALLSQSWSTCCGCVPNLNTQVTPKGWGLRVWLFSNTPPYRQFTLPTSGHLSFGIVYAERLSCIKKTQHNKVKHKQRFI